MAKKKEDKAPQTYSLGFRVAGERAKPKADKKAPSKSKKKK